MFYTVYTIFLVTGALLAEGSPARMFSDRMRRVGPLTDRQTVATVDCTNREAVKYVMQTHTTFRCVYPNWNSPTEYRAPNTGLMSANLVKDTQVKCKPGYMFSVDTGLCLEAQRPQNVAPLESANLIRDKMPLELMSFLNSPSSNKDCPRGTMFNPELGICTKVAKRTYDPLETLNLVRDSDDRLSRPLEISSFNRPVLTAADCKTNQIYVPDIDECVDKISKPSPLRVANLIKRETPAAFSSRITKRACGPNQFFLSEIGTCIDIQVPFTRRPDSASLINDNPIRRVNRPVARPIKEETPQCGPNQLFNPSIGACLDVNRRPDRIDGPLQSSSLVKEPVHLEIQSFTSDASRESCALLGKFYNPSIDACL